MAVFSKLMAACTKLLVFIFERFQLLMAKRGHLVPIAISNTNVLIIGHTSLSCHLACLFDEQGAAALNIVGHMGLKRSGGSRAASELLRALMQEDVQLSFANLEKPQDVVESLVELFPDSATSIDLLVVCTDGLPHSESAPEDITVKRLAACLSNVYKAAKASRPVGACVVVGRLSSLMPHLGKAFFMLSSELQKSLAFMEDADVYLYALKNVEA